MPKKKVNMKRKTVRKYKTKSLKQRMEDFKKVKRTYTV